MKAISVRIKHNSPTKHAGQRAHDLRTGEQNLKYVDYERTPLNSVIIEPKPAAELRQICEARRNASGTYQRRLKSNASVATDGIITFSKEAQAAIEGLSVEEQNQRFQAAAEAIAKALNTTLEGLVVHRDESAIHAHFTLAAYTLDGKPISKSTTRQTLSKLQEIAAETYADLGITRGKPKRQRIADKEPEHKWINRSVQQLHQDLPNEIAELQDQIEKLNQQIAEATERAEKATRNLERTEQKLKEASDENKKLQKRLETYQKRLESAQKAAEEAEATKAALEAEIERLKALLTPREKKPTQKITTIAGWEEKGWGLMKRLEPKTNQLEVITKKAHEQAITAALKRLRDDFEAKLRVEAEKTAEAEQRASEAKKRAKTLLKAIHALHQEHTPPSATSPSTPYRHPMKPRLIRRYNASLLDYGKKLVATGDGTKKQQAAAIYAEAKRKGWDQIEFWGMNQEQVEWLVEAAMADGISISFKEDWAQQLADKLHANAAAKEIAEEIFKAITSNSNDDTHTFGM